MILPGQEIRKRAGMIHPFREKYKFNNISGGLSSASYDVSLDQDISISAHGFILASTAEEFNMPNDVAAVVHDKSTWARVGISLQNTFFDPGFKGFGTLEINNNTNERINIPKNTPIAQVVFHQLLEAAKEPYSGKYQNQKRGPVEPR